MWKKLGGTYKFEKFCFITLEQLDQSGPVQFWTLLDLWNNWTDQEEEIENGEVDVFGSQVNLNNSTHENEVSTNMDHCYSDWFGAVRAINNTVDRKQRSRELMTTNNSDGRS